MEWPDNYRRSNLKGFEYLDCFAADRSNFENTDFELRPSRWCPAFVRTDRASHMINPIAFREYGQARDAFEPRTNFAIPFKPRNYRGRAFVPRIPLTQPPDYEYYNEEKPYFYYYPQFIRRSPRQYDTFIGSSAQSPETCTSTFGNFGPVQCGPTSNNGVDPSPQEQSVGGERNWAAKRNRNSRGPHTVASINQSAPSENRPPLHRVGRCNFFRNGKCKNGERCRFYHAESDSPNSESRNIVTFGGDYDDRSELPTNANLNSNRLTKKIERFPAEGAEKENTTSTTKYHNYGKYRRPDFGNLNNYMTMEHSLKLKPVDVERATEKDLGEDGALLSAPSSDNIIINLYSDCFHTDNNSYVASSVSETGTENSIANSKGTENNFSDTELLRKPQKHVSPKYAPRRSAAIAAGEDFFGKLNSSVSMPDLSEYIHHPESREVYRHHSFNDDESLNGDDEDDDDDDDDDVIIASAQDINGNEIEGTFKNSKSNDLWQIDSSDTVTDETATIAGSIVAPDPFSVDTQTDYGLEVLSSTEDLKTLRELEIQIIKEMIAPDQLQILKEVGQPDIYCIGIPGSIPYDVEFLNVRITIPEDYPKLCFEIVVTEMDNKEFPAGMASHLTRSIRDWLDEKHAKIYHVGKVELLFRPLVHWLQGSMSMLFMISLEQVNKSKATFLAFRQLALSLRYGDIHNGYPNVIHPLCLVINADASVRGLRINESEIAAPSSARASQVDNEAAATAAQELPANNLATPCKKSSEKVADTPRSKKVVGSNSSPPKKGIEITLRHLQLIQNVATLNCVRMMIIVCCNRCKTRIDCTVIENRNHAFHCSKCHNSLTAKFYSNLLHQYCSTLGFLELDGCSVFDLLLVECQFQLGCLLCNKQMMISGLQVGQQYSTWCKSCHAKTVISIGIISFEEHGQVIKIANKKHETKLKKPDKISEGIALPDFGSCKHYKKSFRWFRFPCCGKAYACDLCHDEVEMDHGSTVAARVICGFCAKEQNCSGDKPCIGCKASMTKASGAHWEGGKGRRDKTKLSKDDPHKFSGVNKTVSKQQRAKKK